MRITKESKFYKNCPDCSKILYYSKKYKLERSIKNNSRCFSCAAKTKAKDLNYSKKLSKAIKKSWKDADVRKKQQSERLKNFWKNISEEEKSTIKKKMSDNFNRSEERIEKIRQNSLKLWQDDSFKEKFKKSNLDPKLRLKRRENILKQINDPSSNLNSKECKEKRIKTIKNTWLNKSIEEKNKILDNLSKTLHSFSSKSRSTSKLETWVFKNIEHLNFQHKATICGYCIDIIHKELPIIIEVNGDFWHANPKIYNSDWINNVNKKPAKKIWDLDKKRINKLEKNGYYVHVLWQKDIKNNKSYINEIKNIVELFRIFG